jgi:hypothetical protein
MRLLRVGEPGAERPAVLDAAGIARDVSGIADDFGPAFFAVGPWHPAWDMTGTDERLTWRN